MINATIPLSDIKIILEDMGSELKTVIRFDRNGILLRFGDNLSFEFLMFGSNMRMVTRRFVDGKPTMEASTVASGLTAGPE